MAFITAGSGCVDSTSQITTNLNYPGHERLRDREAQQSYWLRARIENNLDVITTLYLHDVYTYRSTCTKGSTACNDRLALTTMSLLINEPLTLVTGFRSMLSILSQDQLFSLSMTEIKGQLFNVTGKQMYNYQDQFIVI